MQYYLWTVLLELMRLDEHEFLTFMNYTNVNIAGT